jgi:hypothetical protein
MKYILGPVIWIIAFVTLALAFGGCGGIVWHYADDYYKRVDQRQFARDEYECQRDAYGGAGPTPGASTTDYLITGAARQRLYRMCMKSKGYTP